ncbi:MAG: FolB domain-containing protein [Proteobacteria bacterium]|nr:FolB domain-containing protein [Pseudomonadota bacterium]
MEKSTRKIQEVNIENIRLRTIIGANEWERNKLQDVIISIQYKFDASAAVISDSIHDTENYKVLTKKIIQHTEASRYELLESLAEGIFEIVTKSDNVTDVKIVVEKPYALRFSDTVKIVISDHDR